MYMCMYVCVSIYELVRPSCYVPFISWLRLNAPI